MRFSQLRKLVEQLTAGGDGVAPDYTNETTFQGLEIIPALAWPGKEIGDDPIKLLLSFMPNIDDGNLSVSINNNGIVGEENAVTVTLAQLSANTDQPSILVVDHIPAGWSYELSGVDSIGGASQITTIREIPLV